MSRLSVALRQVTRFSKDFLHRLKPEARQEVAQITRLPLDALPKPTEWWPADPRLLLEIARAVRSQRPALIVDIGSGSTTLVAAACCKRFKSGRVIAFDHEAEYAEATRRSIAEHGLQDYATVIHAPLTGVEFPGGRGQWYDPAAFAAVTRPIDLLIVDGPPGSTGPQARYPVAPFLFDRLAGDARIFLDDTHRQDEQQILARIAREYPMFRQTPLETGKGAVMLSRA